MPGSLIDTDWAVDDLHGRSDAVQTLIDLAPAGLAISVITYGGVYEGAYYARDPQTALAGSQALLQGKDLLGLDPPILERFAIVRGALPRQQRNQIGDMLVPYRAAADAIEASHLGYTILRPAGLTDYDARKYGVT